MAAGKQIVLAVALAAGLLGLGYGSGRSQRLPAAADAHPAHPAQTSGWVDTRLYFGLGPVNAPEEGVSEAAWRAFLDKEVTPRFPSGLSVIDVYGQWQSESSGRISRIRSKMLVIDYPGTPENSARIEAIRAAWKRKTGDQSVLRVTQPADVSF